MPIPHIYSPQDLLIDSKIALEPNASKHLLKVLRLKIGDSVVLFNGKGGEFEGKICDFNHLKAIIKIDAYHEAKSESTLNIHLVYGLARFEKTEWVIQKATELGVQKISLIMTHHGEVHLKEDAVASRLERWRSIIISACEQSGRCLIPEVAPPITFKEWIKQNQLGKKFIFHLENQTSLLNYPKLDSSEVTLVIGPEGGFSNEEICACVKQGYEIVGLGPRILRTETAAISAISIAQGLWGDLLV